MPNDLTVGQGITGHWVKVPERIHLDYQAMEAFNDCPPSWPSRSSGSRMASTTSAPARRACAYFFDTGRQSITDPDDGTPIDPWGSIYRIDFHELEGSGRWRRHADADRPLGRPATGWASPDNGDMNPTAGEVMLQEDPANGPWEATAARVRRPSGSSTWNTQGELVDPIGTKIAQVSGGDCSPGASDCWETSGLVDASPWFGAGAWIFDVQAHGQAVPACPECVEDGQLLLMKLQ
ncbi:MAG: hypothetical protein R3E98_19230 [Gemmatimonadota bacterium]